MICGVLTIKFLKTMKVQYFALAAVLLGAASMTSCSNQEEAVAELQTKATCPKVINVKVEGNTRAVMGEGNKPMWEEYTPWSYDGYTYTPESGDMLEVYSYNEEGKVIMAYYACTDAATSEFTLMEDYFHEWDDDDNIIGAYTWEDQETYIGSTSGPVGPYLVYCCQDVVSHADMVNKTINPGQPYMMKPVPSDLSNAIMACYTDDLNNCTLNNVMALLKVTVPADANVNYITLEHYGADDAIYSFETKTWGDYVYETSARSYTIGAFAYPSYYAQTADDIQPIEAGTYYFPLYPQTIISSAEKPFSLKVTYTTGKWEYAEATGWADPDDSFFTTKTKTGSVTLEAGKIYDLGTIGVDL